MLLEEVAISGHSRYPVIGESLDDIRGIIQFKEVAEPLAQHADCLDQPVENWIRPARFVQEYMPLSELLPLMQRSHQQMVMVVDEFGGTAGLVTIEDVVGEILGDAIETDSTEDNLSFVGEASLMGKWHLRPNISLRAGLEILYVESIALAPFQVNFIPGGYSAIASGGDSVYMGGSFGVESYW